MKTREELIKAKGELFTKFCEDLLTPQLTAKDLSQIITEFDNNLWLLNYDLGLNHLYANRRRLKL